jgi:hypothetical protein
VQVGAPDTSAPLAETTGIGIAVGAGFSVVVVPGVPVVVVGSCFGTHRLLTSIVSDGHLKESGTQKMPPERWVCGGQFASVPFGKACGITIGTGFSVVVPGVPVVVVPPPPAGVPVVVFSCGLQISPS